MRWHHQQSIFSRLRLRFTHGRVFWCLVIACLTLEVCFAQITVDPSVPLTKSYATEWNVSGNFESWTSSGTSLFGVANGVLSFKASGANPWIECAAISGGPDLDLGYNDFVDVRVAVPQSFSGSLVLSFGVLNAGLPDQAGLSAAREVVLSQAKLKKDGAPHTYRFDMGLVPLWRGALNNLRITLRGAASGQSFSFDYIRVGDEQGNDYQARISENCPADGAKKVLDDRTHSIRSLESKRFRIIWSDITETEDSNMPWDAAMAKGTLRNLEECWQVYVKKLGYREPCYPMEATQPGSVKYKVNLTMIYAGGTWSGGDSDPAHGGSFGWQNSYPAATRVDPPSWVTPHELMHVFQMHNTSGHMPGNWWESHANYGAERWLEHYEVLFPGTSSLSAAAINDAQLSINPGRSYYMTWPLYYYLDTNPDRFPDLGEGTMVKIWQQAADKTSPYTTLERITPQSSVKDIVGLYARRMATLDFPGRQSAMRAAVGSALEDSLTELECVPDAPGWWRPPREKAPAQGGYVVHPIVPSGSGQGRVVTVDFRGIADPVRGADWRASFVIVDDAGRTRYSPLWNSGTKSVTLAANENKVYLVVAGTPDEFASTEIDDLAYPYRSDPGKQRLHYEVRILGGTPRETSNGSTVGLVQHANGGGWKSPESTVDVTAFVGPNARVLGAAQVRDSARVEDFAVVRDNAVLSNNATASGHSLVMEAASLSDSARVRDHAKVKGNARISGNARVSQGADVGGTAVLADASVAKGTAIVWGGTLSGGATIDGDLMGEVTANNGFAFGHAPYVGVPDSWIRKAPDRIEAAYDFVAARGSCAFDSHGVLTAFIRGSPQWVESEQKQKGFLVFNGSNQWISLDRSLADTRDFTFSAWVKRAGGVSNQALLWMGANPSRRMVFTPDDGSGRAKFSIRNGGPDQSLAAPTALSVGEWSHVVITLNATTGTLYVNGSIAATAPVTIRPEDLLGPNDLSTPQHNYLARAQGSEQPMFAGALDSVQFYSKTLDGGEIADMQPGLKIAGRLLVDLRASDLNGGTWMNRGTLGNFTAVGSPVNIAKVAGTKFDGVKFSGNESFEGPLSVPEIEGNANRTIEVWVYNPDFNEEETVVSWGHRGATRRNMALNFASNGGFGVGAATHWDDDMGWSVQPTANAWHHLVYTYGSGVASVYLDGELAIQKTLGGPLDTFPAEPMNIGCQRESGNGRRLFQFTGFINSVRIHTGVLTPEQVVMNFNFGPVDGVIPVINSASSAPATLGLPFTHRIKASGNPLSFGATGLPAGLILNASTGLITGSPVVSGNFTAIVSATNTAGTGRANLSITVGGNVSATVGTPFTIETQPGNATSFLLSGALPAGLTFNSTSGRITGTPSKVESRQISITPRSGSTPGTPITFNIVVSNPAPPVFSSLSVNGNGTIDQFSAFNTLPGPVLQANIQNPGNHPLKFQWRLDGSQSRSHECRLQHGKRLGSQGGHLRCDGNQRRR
jgi:carbonic anhydrase/acetyltransferase-like protein (isoleucine patch superfamily)